MILRVGIENNNDNRSIAWALEHPGCFAYGVDADEAGRNMAEEGRRYAAWVDAHPLGWLRDEPVEVRVEQTFDDYHVALVNGPSDIQVEAFFPHDQEPLTGTEVQRALKLLEWSRQDLLEVLKGRSRDEMERTHPGERWNINGILQHIAGGEWWYQERIGAPFPEREQDLPSDPLESLELVRRHFTSLLPRLEGLHQTLEVEGELWSPRKVLRRAVWHERDHTQHIRKLL